MTPPVLQLTGITKRFGPLVANDAISLHLNEGEILALLGENGAGKSTLVSILFGHYTADAGHIEVFGKPLPPGNPNAALAAGIGMVHQHFTLVPAMTVAENVALGRHGRYDPSAASARVQDVASRAGLSLDPDALVSALSIGAQQRCEIVKALARDVQLLILDEPTAVLAPSEAAELLRWIRSFADAGHAIVLITHKLRDALAIADDITVLRRGRTVLTAPASTTTESGLATAMLGNQTVPAANGASFRSSVATDQSVGSATTTRGAPVLIAHDVHVADGRGVERVRGATLRVHAGEIVGIAAVEGEGQHELLRVLAGRGEMLSGTLERPDVVGFVPEDRHREALLLDSSLVENVALRGAGARRGRMPWDALRDSAASIVKTYNVLTSGMQSSARTLSGGNQQKLVMGRELESAPSALVVENPTRGLDFRATAAVRDSLRRARDAGAAVVVYSSDLDEVLLLADRIYAMHNGVVTETPRDRESVGRAMLGSATSRE